MCNWRLIFYGRFWKVEESCARSYRYQAHGATNVWLAYGSRTSHQSDLSLLEFSNCQVCNAKETICPYPEIGDANFKCALWTFQQQLTLKMQARCSISIVLLQTSLYCGFRNMINSFSVSRGKRTHKFWNVLWFIEYNWVFPECFHWIRWIQWQKYLSLQIKGSNLPPSHLLRKRPGCYHSTNKTHVRDRIFKLSPIHVYVIYPIRWIQWIPIPFRENLSNFKHKMTLVSIVLSVETRPLEKLVMDTFRLTTL